MSKCNKLKQIVYLSMLILLVGMSSAYAGGFQLFEENVTNLGNAYAGAGAQADDASTEWFNPAGMTRIKHPQFVVSGTMITLNINSTVTSATNTVNGADEPFTGDSFQQPGARVAIPSLHFVYPFKENWAWGFGVNVPFGLKTSYDAASLARYLATETSLEDIEFGPTIAYKVNQYFSMGAGFDMHYMRTELDQMLLDNLTTGYRNFKNILDSFGTGWHAGVLLEPSSATRFGFTYHSQVTQGLSGTASIDSLLTDNEAGGGTVNSTYTSPDSIDLSAYHDINSHWAILGSIDYTHWSILKNITLNYSGPISTEISSIAAPLNFRDTYRLSAGANYRWNNQWLFRVGTAWDQSPVPDDESRTLRLPDSDRIWVALGAQFKLNEALTFDAGYSHLFVKNSSMNNQLAYTIVPSGGPEATVSSAVGTFDSSINEFGLQVTWNIDHR